VSASKDVAAAVSRLVDQKLKNAPTRVPDSLPDQDDPVAVLVQSMLLWQSTTDKAAAAYEKIRKSFVDWNDLRVSMPDEVIAVIGVRYPEADERCQRLRVVLRSLYRREHEMSFKGAEAAGKRSLRKYLESLEGIVSYAAERTLLVAFGGHAMPVDETLRLRLVEAGIVEDDADDEAAAALMLKHVKAADALATHLAFQAWTDEVGPPKLAAPTTRKKTTRTTSKKTTSRKTKKKTTTSAAKSAPAKSAAAKPATRKTTSKKKTTAARTASKSTTKKKKTSRSKSSAS
jgi:endonuclease III